MNSAIMPIPTARFFSPAILSTRSRTRMEELEFLRALYGVSLYSQLPNLFNLELRKSVSDTFLSFDGDICRGQDGSVRLWLFPRSCSHRSPNS